MDATAGSGQAVGLDWRGYLKTIPNFVPPFFPVPRRSALVVVDMQRSCTDRTLPQGRWLAEEYRDIERYYYGRVADVVIPNIARLLDLFRERHGRAVFLTVGSNLDDGADLNPLRQRRDSELAEAHPEGGGPPGPLSPGRAIAPELTPRPDELVLNKVGRSAFSSTGLDRLLRNMRIERLIVAGVVTNGCVSATASEASERGYECVIVDDACAAFTPLLHDTALLQFAHGYGEVRTMGEVIDAIRRLPPGCR
jgi:nicotinamidase-related amidase